MNNEASFFQGEIAGKHDLFRPGETMDVNIFLDVWYTVECTGVVDLTGFKPGNEQKDGVLDVRKSKQFSLTNRGLTERFRDKRFVSDLLKESNRDPSSLEKLYEILKTGCLNPLKPEELDSTVLYHATGPIYTKPGFFRRRIDNLEVMKQFGVYGSAKQVTYLTRDFERAIAHSPKGDGSHILLLILSTKKLMELRDVFIDPESLSMRNEYMRNFVVPHGLPVGSIIKAYTLISKGIRP